MTEQKTSMGTDGGKPTDGDKPTAGAVLAKARVAAGLSIDNVAQQLKLAPRQVRALEDGEYNLLPGRTFVRGVVKGYARLVHLDPEQVLAALPAGTGSALESPKLHPTAPTMGELPIADRSRHSWTRIAIPMALAGIVAAAAVYEWSRPADEKRATTEVNVQATPVTAPAPTAVVPTETPSHNPIVAPVTEVPSPAPPASSPPPVATSSIVVGADPSIAPVGPLTLVFRDNSWTEVRDRDGRVLLSGINPAGTERMLSGSPPLVIVIGNAADVSVTYRGHPVDLTPYTRQNVARLSLP